MLTKLPLKKCKLWWPAWQMGIPFTDYGYTDEVSGDGYSFKVNKEMDSWMCPDGKLMPISTAKLFLQDTLLKYKSFSIINSHEVQVNNLVDHKSNGYTCSMYNIDDLYFIGEAYGEDD